MESYLIRDYKRRKPITVRSHTRGGKQGFVLSFKIFVRKATIVSLVAVIVASSYVSTFFAGALMNPVRVEAHTIERDVPVHVVSPVLERIGKAESRNNQFCTDDAIAHRLCKASQKGTVLMRANTDGSVDIGKYQINNKAWGAEAVDQGYDLMTEKGNEDMAIWIYENVGTGPWYSSAKNW